MRVLSVVCARGGSKGLKDKCTRNIMGRMVIEYSIQYSLSMGNSVQTVVSTDIEDVLDYCKRNGIRHFKRDPGLCRDDTKMDAVLADALDKEGTDFDFTSIVYGNVPTRYPVLFRRAADFLDSRLDYDAVITMQNVEKYHPEWMFTYDERSIPPQTEAPLRRQALPQKMIHDGHTFMFRTEAFYRKFKGLKHYDRRNLYSIFGDSIRPLLNREVIIDIDTERDLELAEAILRGRLNRTAQQGSTQDERISCSAS